jgi:hypothetical protein
MDSQHQNKIGNRAIDRKKFKISNWVSSATSQQPMENQLNTTGIQRTFKVLILKKKKVVKTYKSRTTTIKTTIEINIMNDSI